MVQTDDVSRAVLTGGWCDQWKGVKGSPGTVGSLELGESFSLESAAAALEPKVAAGSKFKGKAACSGGGWTCLLHGWIAFLIRIG